MIRAPSRRQVGAVIAMTSLIDAMLVVVVFLLGTFGQEARAAPFDRPLAKNVTEIVDAPVVTVKDGAIWLDGRYVGSTDEAEATGRVRRLSGLYDALAQRRATARALDPARHPSTVVSLDIESSTPAVVVKSVYFTGAQLGYTDVSLVVLSRP
ncbi:MAG: hypothetical protein JNL38_11510 [Myxococcales bacterium]|nr:hypothetical protein [Myxococcales bacterium]